MSGSHLKLLYLRRKNKKLSLPSLIDGASRLKIDGWDVIKFDRSFYWGFQKGQLEQEIT